MNHLPQSQWWRPLPLFFSYFWMYVIFIYIYMIIYEWRTKLYIAYCSQWTWPKWVVPYRLWRFQHKFEQPKSSPYYFSFPLIFLVTHIYKYMHTCMLDNAMSLVSLPAPPHKYLNPILFRVSWCVPIYLFVVLKRCNIHQARHTCHGKLSLHSPAFPVQRKCLANKKSNHKFIKQTIKVCEWLMLCV